MPPYENSMNIAVESAGKNVEAPESVGYISTLSPPITLAISTYFCNVCMAMAEAALIYEPKIYIQVLCISTSMYQDSKYSSYKALIW